MNKFIDFCQMVGLHPFVGFGMMAVDFMLFGAEGVTGGTTWLISIAVAAALSVPCMLIQKYGMREQWGLAIGKGVMVGILTAIPTALPSIFTFIAGGLGTVALIAGGRSAPIEKKDR